MSLKWRINGTEQGFEVIKILEAFRFYLKLKSTPVYVQVTHMCHESQ